MKLYQLSFAALIAAVALTQAPLRAQVPDPETEKMKADLRTYIDKEVERYESVLNLEYWQVFYMDSIMTHDYTAMQDELMKLKKEKYSNADEYQKVQDKWNEKMYQSVKGVLDPQQWAKYEKGSVAKAKKDRDKRKKLSESK